MLWWRRLSSNCAHEDPGGAAAEVEAEEVQELLAAVVDPRAGAEEVREVHQLAAVLRPDEARR